MCLFNTTLRLKIVLSLLFVWFCSLVCVWFKSNCLGTGSDPSTVYGTVYGTVYCTMYGTLDGILDGTLDGFQTEGRS